MRLTTMFCFHLIRIYKYWAMILVMSFAVVSVVFIPLGGPASAQNSMGSLRLHKAWSEADDPWESTLKLEFNQLLGRGGQFSVDFTGPGSSDGSPSGVNKRHRVSARVRWPVGSAGELLHIGYGYSHAYTPMPHEITSGIGGEFRQLWLELSKPVRFPENDGLSVAITMEATEGDSMAPDLITTLHDAKLRVVRISGFTRHESLSGSQLIMALQLSQGLKWGFSPEFRKIALTASEKSAFAPGFSRTSTMRAQFAWDGPLPSRERFDLRDDKALPPLALGIGPGDAGWTLRDQIAKHISLPGGNMELLIYGYVAGGAITKEVRTTPRLGVASGIGIRGDLGRIKLSLEYGRGRAGSHFDDSLVGGLEVVF